jgi:MHS family metabolite:H+ symporter-like MFS transporter
VSRFGPTQAIVRVSLLGFVTVPVVGLLGDRFGRRPIYIALTALTAPTIVLAFPPMFVHQLQHGRPAVRHDHRP